MRALGVSEAYLSGETNVSNMEAARTSLGKQISAFKDTIVSDLFHKQLFPAFARIHNMRKSTQAELAHGVRTNGYKRAYISARMAANIPEADLLIPTFVTEETLRPEGDPAYLEMLTQLKDLGLPMPLRMLASAAGYDIDKAIAMMSEDAILRKRLLQLGLGDEGGGGDSGGGGGGDDLLDSGDDSGAPASDEAPAGPGGTAQDLEQANSGGSGGMLKPKWGVQSDVVQAQARMYGNQRLISALSKLDPRIMAEVKIPNSMALVPYREKD